MRCSAFVKQCFVVTGVSLNLSQFGLVIGFSALLLPQLRNPDTEIPIDDVTGSWVAAIPSLALLVGNILLPILMGKAGRKVANLASIIFVILGWIGIAFASNVFVLLAARFSQGISLGMSVSSSAVTIAEYTSPKWRGAFLTSLSMMMTLGTLFIHTITSLITWKSAAMVCTGITFVDLLIVALSPETPTWLASKGRYEKCQRVFRWLRTEDEEEELSKLIEASKALRKSNSVTKDSVQELNFNSFVSIVKKKEFYKPIFLAAHLYVTVAVCGINILSAYTVDIINGVTNNSDINIPLVVISLDIQRLITNSIAVYLIRRLKRRTVLFCSGFLNVVAFFLTPSYILLRSMISFDSSIIGVLLIHFHMFSIAIGTLPAPLVICGELYSVKYRSISSGITSVLLSICLFTIMKSFPFLFIGIGLSGSFILYGFVLLYCILIAYFFLPETKDKTLQDIEEEFTGRKFVVDEPSVHTSMLPQLSK